jgi:RNA polymerase sigma-70 factor (ECF subfamily)
MRAYQGMDRFDGNFPRAWLLTIMRNTQINNVRRRRPELLDDQDVTLDRLAASQGSGVGDPEALVEETFDNVVSDALAALPPRFRDVVSLVDLEGLTYGEAAVILGIPVGTAVSRLHRARTRMRQRLQAAGIGPRGGRAE